MNDLKEYESVQDWMLSIGKGTARTYLGCMKYFCEYAQLDPDQLLKASEASPRATHRKLKLYYRKLRSEGRASKTCASAYCAVRSFLAWNDIDLGKSPRYFRGVAEFASMRILEPNEISLMINMARSIRDKAIISFFTQSGQRAGILRALRYRHVREQLYNGTNPIIIDVQEALLGPDHENVNKGRVAYRFAIGKECARFLRLMMQDRKAVGEPIDDESWLFRTYGRVQVLSNGRRTAVHLLSRERGLPMNASNASIRLDIAANRAGVQRTAPGGRVFGRPTLRHEISSRIFRRWWKYRMRRAGITDSDLLDYMIGHNNMRLKHGGEYDEFDPNFIRTQYARAEPFLTVLSGQEPLPIGKPVPRPAIVATPKPRLDKVDKKPNVNQRVVSEWEIETYFDNGWHYVATLPSGRIVLEVLSQG